MDLFEKIIRLPVSWLALEHSLLVLAGLLLYLLLTSMENQRRTPTSAIAWVLLLGLLPYLGIPLFLFFGTRKFARPIRLIKPLHPGLLPQGTLAWATDLLHAMQIPGPTGNASICFHATGEMALKALLDLIRDARQEILLCTFILADDAVGRSVIQALVQSAQRGVCVRLLLDAVGNPPFFRQHLSPLNHPGITVRWFMPLLHNPLKGRSNLRNHRKMLVTDGASLWCGGRNVAEEYFLDRPQQPAWVDLSCVVNGNSACQARALFENDWNMANGIDLSRPASLPSPPVPGESSPGGHLTQIIPSGPNLPDDTLHDLLLTGAFQAREQILAVTPYFVPDEALLAAWCLACRRGVTLTLIIPQRSNHRLADWARESALRELCQVGAQLIVYPQMIHTKLIIMDHDLALCGSLNLDGRSLFLNFEMMAAFYDAQDIRWLEDWFATHRQRGSPYCTAPPGRVARLREGLARTIGFQL